MRRTALAALCIAAAATFSLTGCLPGEDKADGPFPGLIAHSAGFDDEAGVFRILDIWESREDAERFFAEHMEPLMALGPEALPNPATAVEPPLRRGFYELHDVAT